MSDCKDCLHSVSSTLAAAQELRKVGYKQGRGSFPHDVGLVCVKQQTIAPEPFYRCGWTCRDDEVTQ